ncbi:hypothetical protein HK098_004328 [Nowakowskiella sp. JEL0407]|nr:hypothetical protein HK098_004328 [Nowakowskiella sp. JEL0407]
MNESFTQLPEGRASQATLAFRNLDDERSVTLSSTSSSITSIDLPDRTMPLVTTSLTDSLIPSLVSSLSTTPQLSPNPFKSYTPENSLIPPKGRGHHASNATWGSISSSTSTQISIDTQLAENWQPESYHMMRGDARMDQKRRFHAIEKSAYPLPADIQEQDRLELQHLLYRHSFNRAHHFPIDPNVPEGSLRILDVGCGPGAWMRDIAETYPQAKVLGVDMAKSLFTGVEVLPNMKFFTGNILERIPFKDANFDVVHQRLMVTAIPNDKWDHVILELKRVLKPGGYIELCEPDVELLRRGPQFTMLNDAANSAVKARGFNIKIGYEFAKKLKEHGFEIISEHSCSFPMGWGGQHGVLHLINCREIFVGLKPFLSKAFSMTLEQFDAVMVAALEECPVYQTYCNVHAIVGRKL